MMWSSDGKCSEVTDGALDLRVDGGVLEQLNLQCCSGNVHCVN